MRLSNVIQFIACVLIIISCNNKSTVNIHRARDPWAIRSVVDQKPRMLTLALNDDCYVCYDLAHCQLYKVWKGGLALQGAAYSNQKNVQPTSWGTSYDDSIQNIWSVTKNGKTDSATIINRGYHFKNNQVYLEYTMILSSNDSVQIEERPEYIINEKKEPGLERSFTVSHLPENVIVSLHSLNKNFKLQDHSSSLITWFKPLPNQQPPSTEIEYDNKGRYWMSKSDCFTCHELDKNTVGPSFTAVAEKYDNDSSTLNRLVNKVKNGGSGVWGASAMTPHPNLNDAEIKTMLEYIFTLKPEDNASPELVQKITKKSVAEYIKPAFGAAFEGLHPAYDLQTIHTDNFNPRVGGIAFRPNGELLVTTWDTIGAVYALTGVETGDTSKIKVRRIASGLAEPLGITVVDNEIYVLQKQELTHLVDTDGDGIIDHYQAVCNSWGVTGDFHEFAFGLVYKDGYFYATLSMAMRLMSYEKELRDRGRTIKISPGGKYEWINYGLRTPNGIGLGVDDEIFETDNQGEWVPANKLIHLKKGEYHGMRWGFLDSINTLPEIAMPAIWLPENEIGNSPSEPVLMKDGPYKGQMLHGDVTFGGIQRDFIEKVNGEYQGAAFRFTQGLEAGVNRLRFGPDDALYIGGVGMAGGGWSWKDKQYGLQRMKFNGKKVFDILAVRAMPKGFDIELTEEVAPGVQLHSSDFLLKQWYYLATANYGGPKLDLEKLNIETLNLSTDRKHIYLVVRGLKKKHEIYFSLSQNIKNVSGQSLWASEAWYTLNNIPDEHTEKN